MGFKFTHPLPKRCMVAVSGGVDSLSVLHFLNQVEGRVEKVIHVNHASGEFSQESESMVREICEQGKINLAVRQIKEEEKKGESRENFWREQRYRFFAAESALVNLPIVLAHNMDDCLEEYITCTMVRGYWGTIPYKHADCIRPFRLWKRRDIEAYAGKNGLKWVTDPANYDYAKFMRAKVRQHVVPRIRYLNPGVYNIVEKVIQYQDERDGNLP